MTKKQIEELELIARGYVDLYYKDADKLMKNLKNIEEFLKAGGEIFFIDWREVEKIKKRIYSAAMDQYDQLTRTA
ncbi:MAG: hypothetical protein IJ896_15245 [Fibrobacter sp.]|nr:hypothetical protein [Fibrobacter sp.]